MQSCARDPHSIRPLDSSAVSLHDIVMSVPLQYRYNIPLDASAASLQYRSCKYCNESKLKAWIAGVGLNPQPSTLNPQPSILNPSKPSTIKPKACSSMCKTSCRACCGIMPACDHALNPKPSILNPKPLQHRACM